jgi:hypothetical protein
MKKRRERALNENNPFHTIAFDWFIARSVSRIAAWISDINWAISDGRAAVGGQNKAVGVVLHQRLCCLTTDIDR